MIITVRRIYSSGVLRIILVLSANVKGELQSTTNKRPDIVIYNAAGKEISSFKYV